MLEPLNSTLDRHACRQLLERLMVICGLVMAGGMVIPTLTGSNMTPSVMTLGDVSEAHMVEIRDRHDPTVLSGEFRSRVDMLGNTEKDAALMDRRGRTVIGEVEIEIPAPTRDHRRTELEVDVMGLPAREKFAVVVDNRIIGAFTTDDFEAASTWSSRRAKPPVHLSASSGRGHAAPRFVAHGVSTDTGRELAGFISHSSPDGRLR